MLQLFWVLLATALALTDLQTKIVAEEVEVALSGEVNENLGLLLGSDAFQKLDTNGDGFLSKEEIKPYYSYYLKFAAEPLTEDGDLGKIVSRDSFLESVVVPDMGAFGSELNTKFCYLDYAFAETSASTLWTQTFGEVDYVSVEEFVEKTFEAVQPEIKSPVQNLLTKIEESRTRAHLDRANVPHMRLDDYLNVRNPACESRRKLYLGELITAYDLLVSSFFWGDMMANTIGCDSFLWVSQYCTMSSWFTSVNDVFMDGVTDVGSAVVNGVGDVIDWATGWW